MVTSKAVVPPNCRLKKRRCRHGSGILIAQLPTSISHLDDQRKNRPFQRRILITLHLSWPQALCSHRDPSSQSLCPFSSSLRESVMDIQGWNVLQWRVTRNVALRSYSKDLIYWVTNKEVLRRIGMDRDLLQTIQRRQLEFLGHSIREEALEELSLTEKIKRKARRSEDNVLR